MISSRPTQNFAVFPPVNRVMQIGLVHNSRYSAASAARTARGRASARTLPGVHKSSRQVRCKGQWLEIGAEADVGVPRAFAYQLFEDRASIPEFMSWIKEVEVVSPTDSRWKLQQEAFGQVWNLSWLAENQPPIKYQKIHWKTIAGSMKGSGGIEVDNRGEVRFTKTAEDTCKVRLGVQFEVPEPLVPFAVFLVPFGSGVMSKDMQAFARYARDKYTSLKSSASA